MDLYDDRFWEWIAQCPVEHNADPDNVDMYGQRLAGVNFFVEEDDEEQ